MRAMGIMRLDRFQTPAVVVLGRLDPADRRTRPKTNGQVPKASSVYGDPLVVAVATDWETGAVRGKCTVNRVP